ncbi:hypothetical protein HDG37_001874 [Paraburkholderia sp. MM5384-R2]|nr:hypothetical protein [Paraburkholderia sp. MM5384-R2]
MTTLLKKILGSVLVLGGLFFLSTVHQYLVE